MKYALARGHEVTILTRGRSATKVDGVEHLIADREGDLGVLAKRRWDAVLDNNARDYRWVQRSTRALRDSTGHYLFVSSISAYRTPAMSYGSAGDVRMTPVTEAHERFTPPPEWKDGDEAPYGLTKAISEDLVNAAFPGRATIVRPGLIVGSGTVSSFTGSAATTSTVAAQTAEDNARRRLMQILATQIVTKITATAGDWGAS